MQEYKNKIVDNIIKNNFYKLSNEKELDEIISNE